MTLTPQEKLYAGLSQRMPSLKSSPIRDILKVIDEPDMISFAGGLPSASSFPDIQLSEIDRASLQYGPSEGDLALRAAVAQDLTHRGLTTQPDHVLILSGSQQGIDLTAKLVVDHQSTVAVESPTYLAALQVFSLFGARYLPFTPFDLNALTNPKTKPALTYAIPTFQNPTGYVYSRQQRQALAAACDANGSILFEDDPYRELMYSACDRTPACSFIQTSRWIYQSSFSKTLAPGLRLGYLTCSPELFPLLAQLKQAADLHSNRVSQQIIGSLISAPGYTESLRLIVDQYRERRDHFNALLTQHIGSLASWQLPAGGLFFWLTLDPSRHIDTQALLRKALKASVAFMPGEPFYPEGSVPKDSCLRLNFSHASPEAMDTGLRRLAQLLHQAHQ